MCKLSSVTFHGDTIYCVELNGQPYVPLRPIVENLGMDWSAQATKFRTNHNRWGVAMITTPSASTVGMIATVAKDGKEREMLCLPLRKLAAWLASINPKKVRQELRAKIELYQAESDDALWNYWMNGRAERKSASGPIAACKDKFEGYLEEVEAFRARTAADIDALLHKGLNLVEVGRLGPGAIIGFTPVLLDWLQSTAGRTTPLMNPNEPIERAISYSPLYLIRHLEKRLPDLKK